MCLPYPGPRCSYHAHKEYLQALSAYSNEITSSEEKIHLGEILEEKTDNYYSTPRGQNFLRQEADKSEGVEKQRWLLLLQQARTTREEQMKAYNLSMDRKTSTLKEELAVKGKKLDKYGSATGIASLNLLDRYPNVEIKIVNEDTINVTNFGKILVLPYKYQKKWDETKLERNQYTHEDKKFQKLLNETTNTRDLREDQKATFYSWFTGKLETENIEAVICVNSITQDIVLLKTSEIQQVYTARVKKLLRLGGTTAYTGSTDELQEQLKGTPFEKGEILFSDLLKKTIIVGVPPQPEHVKQVGNIYLGYRQTGEEEYYEVRKKHLSKNYDVAVQLKSIRTPTLTGVNPEINKKLLEINSSYEK